MDILNFAREFSSFRRQGARERASAGSARLLGRPRDPPVLGSPRDARARGFRWSAVGDQAAASAAGHVPQVADRLASARARRAAAARAVRSAGTASPLPKSSSPASVRETPNGGKHPVVFPDVDSTNRRIVVRRSDDWEDCQIRALAPGSTACPRRTSAVFLTALLGTVESTAPTILWTSSRSSASTVQSRAAPQFYWVFGLGCRR